MFLRILAILLLFPLSSWATCSDQLKKTIQIQEVLEKDTPEMAKLDLAIWGEKMAASPQKLMSRTKMFGQGQLVAKSGDKIVGFVNSQKIQNPIQYSDPATTWPNVTGHGFIDESHAPNGKVLFLINITVEERAREMGLSRSAIGEALIKKVLDLARAQGISRVEGITRLNGFKKYLEQRNDATVYFDSAVKEYIAKVASGEIRDPALSFHLKAGAQVLGPVKEAMPDDVDSLNWGAIIVYTVK